MDGCRLVVILLSFLFMPWLGVNASNQIEEAMTADDVNLPILSLHSLQANWTFSGSVINEAAEHYNYFFQVQRNFNHFNAKATLIDAQTKAILIYEESNTLIDKPEMTHWQVGNIFLRFNPINSSWVFGIKNKKKSFNFKVDMLGVANTAKQQDLRHGVELLISQTGHLNGHVQTDGTAKEQFVTAKKAWFKQVWVSKLQVMKHPITAVLCQFDDGSAFYSVNLPENDALRGSIVGLRDEHGAAVSVSQFITVKKATTDDWSIHIPSPKINLSIDNLLDKINDNHQLIAGLTTRGLPGFCAISQDDIGEAVG